MVVYVDSVAFALRVAGLNRHLVHHEHIAERAHKLSAIVLDVQACTLPHDGVVASIVASNQAVRGALNSLKEICAVRGDILGASDSRIVTF